MGKSKRIFFKILRILGKALAVILILLLLVILFVRSPWGQNIIKDKLVSTISDKTGTVVELDRLFITFGGNIQLDGLYMEDTKGDTLVYSRHLNADVPLWPLIKGSGFSLDDLQWEGLRAKITRQDSIAGFNFQFLMDAFATPPAAEVDEATPVDTTATMAIHLGNFDLKDFNIVYNDKITGINSRYRFDELGLKLNKTDLDSMDFEASGVTLKNAHINLEQFAPLYPPDTSATAPMPRLVISDVLLQDVRADYKNIDDSLSAKVNLKKLTARIPEVDLRHNRIDVSAFALSDSQIEVENNNPPDKAVPVTGNREMTLREIWPPFTVNVDDFRITNTDIAYAAMGKQPVKGQFDPDALKLENIDFALSDLILKKYEASLKLEGLTFQEASGLNLSNFQFNLNLDENSLNLKGLALQLNKNHLEGELKLDYNTLESFIKDPASSRITASLNNLNADIGEFYLFSPQLKNNEYFVKLARRPITGNIAASGTLGNMNIYGADFNWGTTRISATGNLRHATDPENLQFELKPFNVKTTKRDLTQFIDESELGIKLPPAFTLKGTLAGTTSKFTTDAQLLTDQGTIDIKGYVDITGDIAFDGKIKASQIQLGQILTNESLGDISLNIDAKGQGSDINSLNATINVIVDSFAYNNYKIRDLRLSGDIKDGVGDLKSGYKDDNLDMDLLAHVILDSVAPQVDLNTQIRGADLQALGLAARNVKTALKINARFKGNCERYYITSTIDDGVAVYDDRTYLLGNVNLNAHVTPDTTSVNIKNRILDLDLESNADPADFVNALKRHFTTYLSDVAQTDTLTNPVKIKMRGHVASAPILNEVLLANLRELDTVDITMDFDELARNLSANVKMPYINYNGSIIDSLAISLQSDPENLSFDLGLKGIKSGPIDIKKTTLRGIVQDKALALDFRSTNDTTTVMRISSNITRSKDTLRIHLDPGNLVLNKNKWTIAQDNRITLAPKVMKFDDFLLARNNQKLTISSDKQGMEEEHIAIGFENFSLASILTFLNPEETLASGRLQGEFIVENPFTKPGMLADLDINQFKVMEVDMGTLSLNAKSLNGADYDFDMGVSGGEVDLDLTGKYQSSETAAQLDLKLELNEIKTSALAGFSMGELEEGTGNLSGNINITGTTIDPQYEGTINFNDAGFKVAKLNAPFVLNNEVLKLDNNGIYFNDFTVRDKKQNSFVVDGSIGTENMLDPTFDLNLSANDFQVLDSSKEDFDLVYGTAVFDAEATITGNLTLPDVKAKINVDKGTDVTYVLPPSEVAVESMDGVVTFVNRENPDDILTQTEEESYTITGYNINAVLSISEEAAVNIVIDEETGDNLRITGSGDLDFNMFPNGRTTLAGRYVINDGHYEMSLYNIVNRRFELVKGSTISWAGDPLDAKLDFKARYDVKTSASALMASQTSGTNISTQNEYRRRLPFYVYLNIDGEIMEPKITFNLDMPQDDRGALGGQVYGRVQQLNTQENELNKQVFSLLVLNRFFPSAGSDGSTGGTATIARDNINEALSDQLNVFGEKLLGDTGIQLDFGLDSYTDYQGESAQQRTTLDVAAQKKLFNDRVIVRVGSEVDIEGSAQTGESSPLIGNVSIEYILTEDGRYRLKGFRQNEFQNVIDGQLIVNGIAIIFTQEFNEFKELWASLFKSQAKDEEETSMQKPDEEPQKKPEDDEN